VPPDWLTALAWCWLGLAFVSAAVMLVDIARGYRQPTGSDARRLADHCALPRPGRAARVLKEAM
jgi:hypothetical protein